MKKPNPWKSLGLTEFEYYKMRAELLEGQLADLGKRVQHLAPMARAATLAIPGEMTRNNVRLMQSAIGTVNAGHVRWKMSNGITGRAPAGCALCVQWEKKNDDPMSMHILISATPFIPIYRSEHWESLGVFTMRDLK